MSRDNYYILLGLPLNPPSDDIEIIESVINDKQKQWSTLRMHPSKKTLAQAYLESIPHIRAVMLNETKRTLEAQEAIKIHRKKEKEAFRHLDAAIQLLICKGHIYQKEFACLVKKFGAISQEVIRSRIKVPIIEDSKAGVHKQTFDITTANTIRKNLHIIGKSSLYKFLEVVPTSRLQTLQEATAVKERALARNAVKNAAVTAGGELIGHCRMAFKSEEKRKMYDATLEMQSLESLKQYIDIAGLSGEITAEEYNHLLKIALDLRIEKSSAEDYITSICKQQKWIVTKPTSPAIENFVQCSACGLSNPDAHTKCTHCGYLLVVVCPECEKPHNSGANFCAHCAFAIGDMANALQIIEEAKCNLADKDWQKTLSLLDKALEYWPRNPEALKIREATELQKSVDELVQQLNVVIANKKFYQANLIMRKLQKLQPAHPDIFLNDLIQANLAAAHTWVVKARGTKEFKQINAFYIKALAECKDLPEALEGIAECSPELSCRIASLIARKKFADAQELINKALEYWPASPTLAKRLEMLARSENKERQRQEQLKKRDCLRNKVNQLINEHRYQHAQQIIENLPLDDIDAETRMEIDKELRKAKNLVRQADIAYLADQTVTALSYYRKALAVCNDFAIALEGIQKIKNGRADPKQLVTTEKPAFNPLTCSDINSVTRQISTTKKIIATGTMLSIIGILWAFIAHAWQQKQIYNQAQSVIDEAIAKALHGNYHGAKKQLISMFDRYPQFRPVAAQRLTDMAEQNIKTTGAITCYQVAAEIYFEAKLFRASGESYFLCAQLLHSVKISQNVNWERVAAFYKKAANAFTSAMQISNVDLKKFIAQALCRMAQCHVNIGEYENAGSIYHEVAKIFTKIGDLKYAKACRRFSNIYMNQKHRVICQ